MPFRISHLDDVPLMYLEPSQDHTPSRVRSGLQESLDGYYDRYGSNRAKPQSQIIPLTGEYWGDVTYVGDENGDYLVDEDGNYVIAGDEAQMLRAQIHALAAKLGQVCTLWRVNLDDDAIRWWKRVRFMHMPEPQEQSDLTFKATVSCEFESFMAYWHAENATVASGTAASGIPYPLLVTNSNAPIEDAKLTVECASGTITAVTVVCAALNIDFSWAGTLASGETLVFDDSQDAPPTARLDAFDGFTRGSNHRTSKLLPIQQGTYTISVTVTGGTGTLSLVYYEQIP